MITAIDTNIILDILIADKKYFTDSKNVLDTYIEKGQLIMSEIVYAELACQFDSDRDLKDFLSDTSIKLVHSNEKALSCRGKMEKLLQEEKKTAAMFGMWKICNYTL